MNDTLPIPGFVDLQVNGFRGVDFSSPDLAEEAAAGACRDLLGRGTAAFLPTVITAPLGTYERNLPLLARLLARDEFGGRLLGLHLEGPFIAAEPGYVGAHTPAWVRPPDPQLLARLLDLAGGQVRLVTLAAELPGAADLARLARSRGAAVAIGHSHCTAVDLERLAAAGATAITHLGNGLPAQLPKFDNPLWAELAAEAYTGMLIADGHHIPPPVLRCLVRALGPGRLVAVSDAAPVAGLPPGRYQTLGNEVVLEPSGRLHNPQKGCLVGSSATLLECMNVLAGLGVLTLPELLDAGFHRPLRLLGLGPEAVRGQGALAFDPATHRFGVAP